MKEKFRDKRFNPVKLGLLKHVLDVVNDYTRQGIKLTLRQLYYQIVAKGLIPNNLREYGKLSDLLTDARYAGLVNWDAIEDRVRVPKFPPEFANLNELIKAAINSFRLPRWEGQDNYVELFTEKDALSSVLLPIARRWHIAFCVNRGYSSATALYDLSKRIGEQLREGRKAVVLYLGDHDPSGLDMVRDIRDRVTEFLTMSEDDPLDRDLVDENLEVFPVALTTAQVNRYKPPPNPTKLSDARAAGYIAEFGNTCWEVDALPPEVMVKIVENAIVNYVDLDKMDAVKLREQKEIAALVKFGEQMARKEAGEK